MGTTQLFDLHLFVCTNERKNGEISCGEQYGLDLVAAFKKEINDRKLPLKIRAQRAGCLGVCKQGPTIAIYPEGTFYVGVKPEDVAEIVENHLVNGKKVERLLLNPSLL